MHFGYNFIAIYQYLLWIFYWHIIFIHKRMLNFEIQHDKNRYFIIFIIIIKSSYFNYDFHFKLSCTFCWKKIDRKRQEGDSGKLICLVFLRRAKKKNKLPERSRISLENYVFVLGSFSQQLLPAVEGREKRCRKHRRKREQNFISEESLHSGYMLFL